MNERMEISCLMFNKTRANLSKRPKYTGITQQSQTSLNTAKLNCRLTVAELTCDKDCTMAWGSSMWSQEFVGHPAKRERARMNVVFVMWGSSRNCMVPTGQGRHFLKTPWILPVGHQFTLHNYL
uniref:Uncharacterized protein n=1 Tax=Timema monikensis TaxID=170555 RepID=A0A7R9E8L0_9NEOP|nr:unnamed protein product [Timema monikensis]